jgi:hypothetical protein
VESSDIPNRLLVPIPVECVLGDREKEDYWSSTLRRGTQEIQALSLSSTNKSSSGDSNVKLGPSAFNEFQLVRIVLCLWYKFQCFSANKVPP